jgi:hypothetical protein
MTSLNAIRIKNFRSLEDTGEISLKKLNLLVGRNSGGKSTFARFMPLIRQSTEVRKKSPVLWYGSMVDFGSFKDSVRDSNLKNEIEFSFRLALDRTTMKNGPLSTIESNAPSYNVLATITLVAAKNRGETAVSKLSFDFEGTRCTLEFGGGNLESVRVGDLLEQINPALRQYITFTGLLPTIQMFKFSKMKVGDQEVSVPVNTNVFIAPLARRIISATKNTITQEAAEAIAEKFTFGTKNEILAQLKVNSEAPQRWQSFCKNLDEKNPFFEQIMNDVLMASLPQLITNVDEAISALARNVSYLEPLRATAQRYYRRQELAVDELDSRGENVPFFLDNLEPYEKRALDEWMLKNFGITVEAESSGGHIAIRIKLTNSSKAVNLADTGFGYSQVLPIALQLWKLTFGDHYRAASNNYPQKIVVMEQPELHLHPALQAKLADILVASISDASQRYYAESDLRITVETHSPSIINRIGELVALKLIDPNDVQVIVFEKDDISGVTATRIAEYGKDGRLKNWPTGFFTTLDDDEFDDN